MQLQSKLQNSICAQLPWARRLCRGDSPKRRAAEGRIRIAEIRVVDHVEALRASLELPSFGDRENAADRGVKFEGPRPVYRIPSEIPVRSGGILNQSRGIQVLRKPRTPIGVHNIRRHLLRPIENG